MTGSVRRLTGSRSVRTMLDWESLRDSQDTDGIASRLIAESQSWDFQALAADPLGTLEASDEVEVVLQERLATACGGGGYYRPSPATIYLHQSILRRDNFTLLHELGHHIQEHHPEWSYLLMDMSDRSAQLLEEGVCNAFATMILMPWNEGPIDAIDAHPADLMAGLYDGSQASRSAVLFRVQKLMPPSAKWILAVADLEGRVQVACTTYSDAQPAKDSRQPGFAAVATEALSGPVRRRFTEGLRYTTGAELHDMVVEGVLDRDGTYAFIALRPEARFGTGKFEWPTFSCPNTACDREFEVRYVRSYCDRCGDPHCPTCGRCGCEQQTTTPLCRKCNCYWAPGEVSAGQHDCW